MVKYNSNCGVAKCGTPEILVLSLQSALMYTNGILEFR